MKHLLSSFSKVDSCITYLGMSDDEITGQLIELSESYFHINENMGKLSKRMPFLIAESYQNVIRHSDQGNTEISGNQDKDFFQICFLSDRVVICAVNKIKQKHVDLLNEKIENINTLSKKELSALWQRKITGNQMSAKGGAGLGLIEMARKSDLPIQKHFVPIDEEMSLFFFGIEVIKKDVLTQSNFDISKTAAQYEKFIKKGIILEYSGPFSQEINVPLIEMLENNLTNGNQMDSDAAENLSMIIEVMQNVSKHGLEINDEKSGVFDIYYTDNQLGVSCGNYMDHATYQNFLSYIERIKAMTPLELKEERNRQLLSEELTDKGGGGLGMLEIALFTNNSFDYSFQKTPNNDYFYTIEIKLKSNG